MKIIFDNGGQTCNKFWSYIPILYNSIKSKQKMYIVGPILELEDYPYLKNNKHLSFPFYNRWLIKKFKSKYLFFLSRIFRNKYWDIVTPLCKYFNIFEDAWKNIDSEIPETDLNQIKSIFFPKKKIQEDVMKDLLPYRQNGNIIVGIHIRRGDYKQWHSGKYYYEFREYAECCHAIQLYFKQKITFLLCSNEKIEYEAFEGIRVIKLSQSSSTHDLFALACCDYIIGPPSTFSTWASFMGNKPISFIFSTKDYLPDFHIVKSHYQYDNGKDIIYH